jgi:hypothetical protein
VGSVGVIIAAVGEEAVAFGAAVVAGFAHRVSPEGNSW